MAAHDPAATTCAIGRGGADDALGFAVVVLALAGLASRRSRHRAMWFALSLLGCSAADPDAESSDPPVHRLCSQRFVGVRTHPAAITIVDRPADSGLGFGVRAANMDGCAIALRARFVDASSGALAAESGVFVEIPDSGAVSLGLPISNSTLAHVELPRPGRYDVVVAAEDALGRQAMATKTVDYPSEMP